MCFAVHHVHAHVRERFAVEKAILCTQQESCCDEILSGGNDRLSVLRCREIVLHTHQVDGLSTSLFRLGYVKVHLVSVEIGVIRTANTLVQSESPPRTDLNQVAHNTELMKRRLTVEENDIAIF